MMHAPIILLKEGTDSSQGIPQLVSNISACQVVAEAVRTTLGPRGMDKLILDSSGKATISNDGATILKLLDVVHPAAKMLVDIARAQDAEVGDGTTSVTLLAAELLKQAKPHVEEGIHPQLIIRAYRKGATLASRLVAGVAFKKTFSYAGFEMQPKHYENPLIALLNIELELKAEKENAEIRLKSVQEYQAVVEAEWSILYEKLEKIVTSGARVVLSRLAIGDVATQYFADRDIFCAGRVAEDDLRRTMMACGGAIQTNVSDLPEHVLGCCQSFEEIQIGSERYNIFAGCPQAKTCTILLRGGTEQFMEETERSLHDAIMIVRRATKSDAVVGGGGAVEMEVSRFLREASRAEPGKQQLPLAGFARALEVVPRQLCSNAGFDATSMLNRLRQQHAQGHLWSGVDVVNEGVTDTFTACVWEPALVKVNAITAACEAACLILSVDETIRNPKSTVDAPQALPGGGMG
uniref:T-complex protein 1 subunit eta n=1 Tax=Eptatretus burgeri TaxID=7764 RepID=A0A8C4QQ53_EPTBU